MKIVREQTDTHTPAEKLGNYQRVEVDKSGERVNSRVLMTSMTTQEQAVVEQEHILTLIFLTQSGVFLFLCLSLV